MEGLTQISEFKTLYKIPDHVLSIKFLDDYKRNQEFNETEPTNPPRKIIEANLPQSTAQGENHPIEIVNVMDSDLLMEEIERVKEKLRTLDAQDEKSTAILRALARLEEGRAEKRSAKEEGFEDKRETSGRRDRHCQHHRCRKSKDDHVAAAGL